MVQHVSRVTLDLRSTFSRNPWLTDQYYIYLCWLNEKALETKNKQKIENQANAMILLWLRLKKQEKPWTILNQPLQYAGFCLCGPNRRKYDEERTEENEETEFSRFSLCCNFRIKFLEVFVLNLVLVHGIYMINMALTFFSEIYIIVSCSMFNWWRYATACILLLSRSKFIVGC